MWAALQAQVAVLEVQKGEMQAEMAGHLNSRQKIHVTQQMKREIESLQETIRWGPSSYSEVYIYNLAYYIYIYIYSYIQYIILPISFVCLNSCIYPTGWQEQAGRVCRKGHSHRVS